MLFLCAILVSTNIRNKETKTFHLYNEKISYILCVLENGHPAIELLQENGSRISEFQYDSYEIIDGKPKLSGLPATYTESEEEAQTLRIFLKDALTGAKLALLYTIFDEYSAIARSAYIENAGEKNLHVLNMMSLSLDLPDKDYGW